MFLLTRQSRRRWSIGPLPSSFTRSCPFVFSARERKWPRLGSQSDSALAPPVGRSVRRSLPPPSFPSARRRTDTQKFNRASGAAVCEAAGPARAHAQPLSRGTVWAARLGRPRSCVIIPKLGSSLSIHFVFDGKHVLHFSVIAPAACPRECCIRSIQSPPALGLWVTATSGPWTDPIAAKTAREMRPR